MSFNKVILIGNVGKDPDVRHLPSGGTVANFSLATSDRARDKSGNWVDQTEWHTIVCWGSNADVAERFIRKGTQAADTNPLCHKTVDNSRMGSSNSTVSHSSLTNSRPPLL